MESQEFKLKVYGEVLLALLNRNPPCVYTEVGLWLIWQDLKREFSEETTS